MRDDVTELLGAINAGNTDAKHALLPLIYEELRGIAKRSIEGEKPGLTIESTDLVHEAYLRLMGSDSDWESRAHFYGAAATAMRRILVERARKRIRRSDRLERIPMPKDFTVMSASLDVPAEIIIELDASLDRLAVESQRKLDVVMLRYFTGLSIEDTARVLEVSVSTVKTDWSFARAWLFREIRRRISG